VFPIIDGTPSIPGSSIRVGGGTTNSLSEFPEWRSVRTSNVGEDVLASSASSALLAVDLGPQREPSHADRESSLDGPGLHELSPESAEPTEDVLESPTIQGNLVPRRGSGGACLLRRSGGRIRPIIEEWTRG